MSESHALPLPKGPRTWTAYEIRAMLLEMMDTDTNNNDMVVNVAHIRRYFTDRGIDMIGETRTVTTYRDE